MIFKSLSRADAKTAMNEWIAHDVDPVVENEYLDIRNHLLLKYDKIVNAYSKDYDKDLYFGTEVYLLLISLNGFNMRIAADDGFWMYLSLKVVPDIVSKRWGKNNESHFWERSTRIWLKSIWWYIHLSWQGNIDETINVLKNNSTDEILNLVERAGRKGYNIEVYRNIIYCYSTVSQDIKQSFNKGRDTLFRRIMILNTAYSQTIEPALYAEKEKGYVKWLFQSLGIMVN